MLRQASRSLFVARSRVLLAASTRVPTKGATQASWNPEQGQTAEQRQQATMRRVASGQATAQSVEPMGENWERRQDVDKQGLWERAKDAAQAAKDALSSNAEKVQEKAQDTTQKMNYKMEAAGETLGDKYQNAKETITEKYEDMKEAVGEKIDNFKDAMQSRTPSNTNQRATQQRQVSAKKGSNQPLGKEHTKIDMSLAAMNEEITIQDLQGDMSHDDEVIAHAAGKARSSNLNDPATAFSTEDLTLQAKGVAPQRFQREITFRGDNVITQDDSDDFEPTYQAQRSQQSFGENMKDTAKAAGETGKQAGSSFMKGLKDTAQAVQNKEAGKKNWQVGDKKSQSWSEVKDSADKQFEKFMQSDDKQSEWGQRKGPAFGLEDLTGPTPASTNTFNQKDAGMPQEDIKDLDKQARIGEEEDMNESKDKNLKSGKKDQKRKDDKNLKSKDEQPEIKSNFGKKKGPAFGVAELSDAGTDAARSTTASSQSKAKGSNDVKGMAQEEAGPKDGTNDVARNIALGAPSKTY